MTTTMMMMSMTIIIIIIIISKDRLSRLVLGYDAGKNKQTYSMQKETNLIKQKYMTQKPAAQNIENRFKYSTEKQKIEELKRKPIHEQLNTGTLKDYQQIRTNPWRVHEAQVLRGKRKVQQQQPKIKHSMCVIIIRTS